MRSVLSVVIFSLVSLVDSGIFPPSLSGTTHLDNGRMTRQSTGRRPTAQGVAGVLSAAVTLDVSRVRGEPLLRHVKPAPDRLSRAVPRAV
jgi:hypothetical protein